MTTQFAQQDKVGVAIESVSEILSVGATAATLTITVEDYTQLSNTIVAVLVAGIAELTVEEGIDWTAGVSNDATATSLASALGASAIISAVANANVITVTAVTEGYSGNLIEVSSSDGTNLPIDGNGTTTSAFLENGLYSFTGTFQLHPICTSKGDVAGDGGINGASITFSGSTFLREVRSPDLVVQQGDYFVNYSTGQWKVYTPDGEAGSITASYYVNKLLVKAEVEASFSDKMTVSQALAVLAEGEITVTTAGTPVVMASNANAKAVLVMNNNKTGVEIAVGLQATVDANSTPQIGRVLQTLDSTIVYVTSNSNEVYVDATSNSTKVAYQILG